MQFRSSAPWTTGATVLISLALVALSGCGGAEARKARYLVSGKEYVEQGNFEKARVEFSNAAQIDPKDADARYLIGTVAEKLNNPREAVGQYQAAIDSNPKHQDARAGLARLYLFGGLTDKAMELVAPGLQEEPNNPKLLVVRAAAKLRQGDHAGALVDAEQSYKLAPDDPNAIALLSSMYRNNQQLDKAFEIVRAGVERLPKNVDLRIVLADLSLAAQKPQEAEEQLKKVIELEPSKAAHRMQLARFYMLAKDIDGAERTLREATKTLPPEAQVEARLALVEFLLSQRGAETAAKQVDSFLAERPKDTAFRLSMGGYFERRGDRDRARTLYREVIAQSGVQADGLSARNRLAALAVGESNFDAASPLIEEVLAANSRDADALILRGNIALMRGDSVKAITDLRSVLRDQPNSIPVMRALARAHLQNNEVALAEETLHSAIQVNPKDSAARFDLAQLLAQTGRVEQAQPVLQALIDETPTDVSALEAMFRLQVQQRKLEDARRTAASIQAVQPDRALGYYLQGTIDEAEQKPDRAATAYQRALDREPRAAEPLTSLVRLDLIAKNTDRALARLEQMITREPQHGVAYNLQGELLTSLKRYDEAAQSFKKAIEFSPAWALPYRGLALAELGARRDAAAIQALATGASKASAAGMLYADLAALHERQGNSDEAIKTYEEWLRREPRSLIVANNLAMLLVNYRSDKDSLERAQQLAELLAMSQDAAMLNTRGWVKYKSGAASEALPLLQQAVEKSPDSPVMRYHLAMAQLKSGEGAAARKNLETALNTGKKFFGMDDAKAALAQLKVSG